ncbi:MAG: 16S rRNA processing protein RimM [Eubacterium sp.]|nr:16S rRNA processing protein RimM [Eubacterium sp.]
MTDKFRIGIITKTHGLKGEMAVFPTSDDPERYSELERCFIKRGNDYIEVTCNSCKYMKNTVVLGFDEIKSIEEAEKYIKSEIYVDREDAVPLEEGEYYMADILGFKAVLEDGTVIGTLEDYMDTPAQTILIIKAESDGRQIMIPDVPEFVREIDEEEKKIVIRPVKGML